MGREGSLSDQEQEGPAGLWSLVPTGLGYHILFGQIGFLPLPACHKISFPTWLGCFFQFRPNAGSHTFGPPPCLGQLCTSSALLLWFALDLLNICVQAVFVLVTNDSKLKNLRLSLRKLSISFQNEPSEISRHGL